jgi:hypothetical protein
MNFRSLLRRLLACSLAIMAATGTLAAATLEGIVFSAEPGQVFVPVDEAVDALNWCVGRDDERKIFQLNDMELRAGSLRTLTDGTELVSTEMLAKAGAPVSTPDEKDRIRVGRLFRGFTLLVSPQQVEIDLAKQRLEARQGSRLVLQTRISSGRNGRTPAGNFRAGPFRAVMHRSSRYNNAPMPWSVQIHGHIFVHGFTSVPNYPASHGCIRLPLDEGNPAKFFFEWVLSGTPVNVK